MSGTMNFSYGRSARPGIRSRTTFDAILAGERTSTTRYLIWPGADRYRALRPGDVVRFFEAREMRGRSLDVVVREIRDIDMARFGEAEFEAWSVAEGWSVAATRDFARRGRGRAVQMLYELAPWCRPGTTPEAEPDSPLAKAVPDPAPVAEPAQASFRF